MPKLEFVLDLPGVPVERLWEMYSTLDTLPLLMPSGMHLTIPNPPAQLGLGSRFTLRVTQPPFFVPLPWECFYTAYEPPRLFVDEQGKGPFTIWRHEHHFEPLPDGRGSRLRDRITYEPPFGLLGKLADWLLLRPILKRTFAHRHEVTRRSLGSLGSLGH